MTEIERLIQVFAKLPGLGPRSARRAVLFLLKRRETYLQPLADALIAARQIRPCGICGNFDGSDPCAICRDPARDPGLLCVVEDVADLWAIERTKAFRGRYHVLGGTLSALDGVGPEDLDIEGLLRRAGPPIESPAIGGPGISETTGEGMSGHGRTEIIIALNATAEGQTTAHYIVDRLAGTGVMISRLAHGVPIGGELDYLDEGTLTAALKARRPL